MPAKRSMKESLGRGCGELRGLGWDAATRRC
jgi:hypothetical protein